MRGLAHRLREPLEAAERGHLLETLVLHELRAYQNVSSCGGDLAYWRTPSGTEVDFVWTRGKRTVAIEVKSSPRWRGEFAYGLRELAAAGVAQRCFGVYLGHARLRDGDIEIFPLLDFLRELDAGRVIGS